MAQKFNIVWVLALLILAVLVISGMRGGVAPTQEKNTAQGEVTLTVTQPPVQEQGKVQIVVEKPKGSSANTG